MSDQDFDEFIARRRPLFRRDVDDGLEPPAELDRIVLRQAREAIEGERPMRMLGMPRWAAPVAIAATLVLGLSIVFKAGIEAPRRAPEVTVESVAQRIDYPAPAEERASIPAPPPASQGPVVVELGSPMTPSVTAAHGPSSPAPPPPGTTAGREGVKEASNDATITASAPALEDAPAWRRDARSWQAEIERLRAAGDVARANAEQAEYNRQYRAYAVSPDR